MRRTEQLQGPRRFTDAYRAEPGRGVGDLGVSERTFRRWRDTGRGRKVHDRRLGRARGAGLRLFETRYWDFTAKHFHEKRLASTAGYNWLRLTLQAHGKIKPAARRGAHRRKRPRRPLAGMPHQDASPWWVAGQIGTWWSDDATSSIGLPSRRKAP